MSEKSNTNPDWAKIRAEYVNGTISLDELAKKYNVSQSAVKKRSANGKWSEERRKKAKKKADKVAEKLHDKDVKQTVKDIERCCKAAGRLIDKINKGIEEVDKDIYISTEEKVFENTETKSDDGSTDIIKTKQKRQIRTTRFETLVNTKKIAELSKSLLNIKQILTDIDNNNSDDENCGIIEIPAMQELQPPEEEGGADEQ